MYPPGGNLARGPPSSANRGTTGTAPDRHRANLLLNLSKTPRAQLTDEAGNRLRQLSHRRRLPSRRSRATPPFTRQPPAKAGVRGSEPAAAARPTPPTRPATEALTGGWADAKLWLGTSEKAACGASPGEPGALVPFNRTRACPACSVHGATGRNPPRSIGSSVRRRGHG
jgi:hypothetical protein